MASPTIGQPIAAQWTLSWCVRPVSGSSASQVNRGEALIKPRDGPAPSPLVGEGWGGGCAANSESGTYPPPCPSPRVRCGGRSPTRGEGTQAALLPATSCAAVSAGIRPRPSTFHVVTAGWPLASVFIHQP